jgi:hypothetical protein
MIDDTIDATFEFDPAIDPAVATAAVMELLEALPGATDIDAEAGSPMAADVPQVAVTVLAVFTVLRVTVRQLDELTTEVTELVKKVKALRRVALRAGDEEREIDAG